jgi:peptidoglycan/LPS O-acetylase OafA/YrhL
MVKPSSIRYEELDSIRGLAALIVLIFHVLNVFMYWDIIPPLISKSPMRVLWSGHQAVILFFVLSGFVLFLPFLKRKQPYLPYIIKRIGRIWIPFFVALFWQSC